MLSRYETNSNGWGGPPLIHPNYSISIALDYCLRNKQFDLIVLILTNVKNDGKKIRKKKCFTIV